MGKEVIGVVKDVSPYKAGTNQRGQWSFQVLTLAWYGKDTKVGVWNHADMGEEKGRLAKFTDVQDGVDKNKEPLLQINNQGGRVTFSDAPASEHRSHSEGPSKGSSTKITIDQIDAVAEHVIRKFTPILPSEGDRAYAAARLANCYITLFSRGDFVIPEPDESDLPF